ncbi:hypothetical protein DFJ74DRAFT_206593 [Hyaloraphidium curvatum]|nr:hypothetical protein DFJ74DRAFT_206593 [Hyaloraphidium curvatum]
MGALSLHNLSRCLEEAHASGPSMISAATSGVSRTHTCFPSTSTTSSGTPSASSLLFTASASNKGSDRASTSVAGGTLLPRLFSLASLSAGPHATALVTPPSTPAGTFKACSRIPSTSSFPSPCIHPSVNPASTIFTLSDAGKLPVMPITLAINSMNAAAGRGIGYGSSEKRKNRVQFIMPSPASARARNSMSSPTLAPQLVPTYTASPSTATEGSASASDTASARFSIEVRVRGLSHAGHAPWPGRSTSTTRCAAARRAARGPYVCCAETKVGGTRTKVGRAGALGCSAATESGPWRVATRRKMGCIIAMARWGCGRQDWQLIRPS